MKLSLPQRRILELLSMNCRLTDTAIGKAVRLSEDTVSYHIKQLIDVRKLARFNVQYDYHRLGYTSYHVFASGQIIDHPDIISINTGFGRYPLQYVFLAKNDMQKQKILAIIERASEEVIVCTLSSILRPFTDVIAPIRVDTTVPKTQKSFFPVSRDYPSTKHDTLVLSAKDKCLLQVLVEAPRASYQELSRKSGVNHETVRYRLRSMVEKGIISHFGLLHDFKKYGLYTIYVLCKERLDAAVVRSIPQIFYAAALQGKYQTLAYLAVTDVEELHDALSQLGARVDIIHLQNVHKYRQIPGNI